MKENWIVGIEFAFFQMWVIGLENKTKNPVLGFDKALAARFSDKESEEVGNKIEDLADFGKDEFLNYEEI